MAFSTVLSLPPTSEALKFVGIERERHGSWRSTESKRVDEEARGGERAENNIETPAAGAAAEVALMGDFEIFEKCSQFRYVRVCVCVCVCVCIYPIRPPITVSELDDFRDISGEYRSMWEGCPSLFVHYNPVSLSQGMWWRGKTFVEIFMKIKELSDEI